MILCLLSWLEVCREKKERNAAHKFAAGAGDVMRFARRAVHFTKALMW